MNDKNSPSVASKTVQKRRNQRRSDRRHQDTVSQALKYFDDQTRNLSLSRTHRARCRDLIRGSARPSVMAGKLARGACKSPPPDRDLHLSDVQEIRVALWRKWGVDRSEKITTSPSADDSQRLIDELTGGNEVEVEISPYSEGPVTALFDLAAFDDALTKLLARCS